MASERGGVRRTIIAVAGALAMIGVAALVVLVMFSGVVGQPGS